MAETTDPVADLRAAAKLMRERASLATPGPWGTPAECPGEITYGYHRVGDRHVATWIATIDVSDEDISEAELAANGEHIASWHPLVALAVADWLDERARELDDMAAGPYGQAGAAFVAGDFGGDIDPALRVARAYLGESATAQQGGK